MVFNKGKDNKCGGKGNDSWKKQRHPPTSSGHGYAKKKSQILHTTFSPLSSSTTKSKLEYTSN